MDISRLEIESWFPNIVGNPFKIFEANEIYNCIAFTLNIYDKWIWPNASGWPWQQVSRGLRLENFKQLYEFYGFEESNNPFYEEEYDKIAIYSKGDYISHAAKQFGELWRSKLRDKVIIEHELEWLCGDTEYAYGDVVFIMQKKNIKN